MQPTLYVFGGEALASAERIRQAITVINQARRKKQLLVFASALPGVQSTIRRLLPPSTTQEDRSEGLAQIADRYVRLLHDIARSGADERFEILHLQYLTEVRQQPPPPSSAERSAWEDRMYSWGERLAAAMLAAALRASDCPAEYHDAERLLFTDGRFGHAHVWRNESEQQIRQWYSEVRDASVPVLASGIGADAEGRSTTLGPNGHNFTATIFGNTLRAERVELRTGHNRVQIHEAEERTGSPIESPMYVLKPDRIGAGLRGMPVSSRRATSALPELHPPVDIILSGTETALGQAFLTAMHEQSSADGSTSPRIRVVAVTDSERMAVDPEGLPVPPYDAILEAGIPFDAQMLRRQCSGKEVHLVDCSSSAANTSLYGAILQDGGRVFTANRKALSGPSAGWFSSAESHMGNAVYAHAALDGGSIFITALEDRLQKGDGPLRIEMTPSAWINRLLDMINDGTAFSEALAQSLSGGATDSTPVEELTGREAAAQFTVMLRRCGADIDTCDIATESLLPEEYALHGSLDNLLRWAEGENPAWRERVGRARAQGKKLAYVASADAWYADIRVRTVQQDSPLSTRGGKPALSLYTSLHEDEPLTVIAAALSVDHRAQSLLSDVLSRGIRDTHPRASRQSSHHFPAAPPAEAENSHAVAAASWTSHAVGS